MKTCTKCKENKELNKFVKCERGLFGRHSICKVCKSVVTKKWKEDNRDREMNNQVMWHKNNKDIEKVKRRNWYENNKEQEFLNMKKWRMANSDTVRAINAKRRAAKLQRTPKWLTDEHFKQIKEFYINAKELEDKTNIEYHVDHIVPLQGETVSGLHVPWNLRVITAEENLKKGNRF